MLPFESALDSQMINALQLQSQRESGGYNIINTR